MLAPLSARQTLERARTIMQAGGGASLPELLKIVETLSLNLSEVTISELGELIEKDAIVLAKIISVANLVSHNPGIAPLTTLSQAIHQIGFNRIRTIAVSLMLLDTAGATNPPEQREAAALALCAGLLAQGTAEQLGTHDPEFVFACAALRNFGPIMFAAVSVEHARAATALSAEVGLPAAYRAQFGLTPLEFTRELLSSAHLPESLLNTLRDCEPETLKSVASTYEARLLGLADYASRLATLTLEPRHGTDAYTAQLRSLGRRFDRLVPGAVDLARPALQRADERLHQFTHSTAGGRALPTKSLARIDWRLQQLSPTEIPPDRPDDVTLGELPAAATATTTDAPPPERQAFATVSSTNIADFDPSTLVYPDDPPVATPPTFTESTDALLDPLEEIRREFSAQECWLFRADPGETSLALARALGHAAARPSAKIRLDPGERSVFGLCLARREIVLIHNAAESPHLPRWFSHNLGAPAAFCLIPLQEPGQPRSLLLVGWTTPRRIVLTAAQLARTKAFLMPSAA